MKIINNFPKLTKLDNIENELTDKAPANHASTTTNYGASTASNYGHVKLSDSYTTSAGAASASVAASSKAVADAYNEINSNLDNYVGVKNLTTYATQTYNTSVHVPIEFDGYLCERVNFTAQSGYSVLYIKDENKETIFSHQLNCGVNVGYAQDGSFLPVKKGWYFYIEGQSIQSVQIKFTHI